MAELAAELGVSEDDVRERQRATERATLLQLDQPISDGEGGVATLESLLPEQDEAVLPADSLEERELLGTMRVAVAHLDETHREVVERYFYGGELLQDIAATLGVTEARVSQDPVRGHHRDACLARDALRRRAWRAHRGPRGSSPGLLPGDDAGPHDVAALPGGCGRAGDGDDGLTPSVPVRPAEGYHVDPWP